MADVISGFGGSDIDPEIAAAPQASYRMMQELTPVLRLDGMVMISRHEDVMHALRHPELFSSNMDAIDIGNVRPLIPLQIDPPDHVKFRRLLDPLFSPKEVAKLEPEVRRLVNELIDDFEAAGECEFSDQFAIPLPCTVFLALLGLPIEDLTLTLRFKDRDHPARRWPRRRYCQGHSSAAGRARRSTRTSRVSSTRAAPSPRRPHQWLHRRRSRRSAPERQRHPRYLLSCSCSPGSTP